LIDTVAQLQDEIDIMDHLFSMMWVPYQARSICWPVAEPIAAPRAALARAAICCGYVDKAAARVLS
jgi:hypothetical protein